MVATKDWYTSAKGPKFYFKKFSSSNFMAKNIKLDLNDKNSLS